MTAPDLRRQTPRTDRLLADPRIAPHVDRLGSRVVKEHIARAQDRIRAGEIGADHAVESVLAALPDLSTSLRPVINATGVLLHTNLGRAPLSDAARAALVAAAGTTDVELDLATGRRGRRGQGVIAALLERVPAAGDALVVNNGAAALVLAATSLAAGREIVISRGEMVEIGDGFRLPELLTSTGARLREVGTTNRTTVGDYAEVVGQDTAFILKVHPSNFVVRGFTASASIAELAGLGVPVVHDIGSGLLRGHPRLPDEPDAEAALRAGAALVTCSGDKLLGGPQAGVVLGRADLVPRLRKHPLARALRVDKLTLAALEATLVGPEPPTVQALDRSSDELADRAAGLAAELRRASVDAQPVRTVGSVGGGGAPGVPIPSAAVSLPEGYARLLRTGSTPILGRVADGRCLLDLLAVPPGSDAAVLAAVRSVAGLQG